MNNDFESFQAYRNHAVAYWEKRRIGYNLMLIPPTVFGMTIAYSLAKTDAIPLSALKPDALVMLCGAVIGANICYSFVYVLEFWMASRVRASLWLSPGRLLTYIAGIFIGMMAAASGGMEIVRLHYVSP